MQKPIAARIIHHTPRLAHAANNITLNNLAKALQALARIRRQRLVLHGDVVNRRVAEDPGDEAAVAGGEVVGEDDGLAFFDDGAVALKVFGAEVFVAPDEGFFRRVVVRAMAAAGEEAPGLKLARAMGVEDWGWEGGGEEKEEGEG